MDNNNGSGANGNKVQIWACDGFAPAQNWTVNTNGTITIDGGCLDITGANNNGTRWSCGPATADPTSNGKRQNGASRQPRLRQMPRCPQRNTTNGTQLQIWSCSGANNQKWTIL